ncbi:DNA-processing protein DprA [Nocardia abscessus]|uniref:DNA-processing protein DprA n=1 Tax=Nocardia abscessus TaxID=120957 RepID=UPI001893ABAD|nr:DNA-processing protein DprA [Nocardia abscessus]MBF6341283.1 DNA-processing protein DprA [Nocardia abscessus]
MNSTAYQLECDPTKYPRRLAWALLSVAARGPADALWQLVATHGVTDTAAMLARKNAVGVDRSILQRAAAGHAARLLASHYAAGGRLVTPDDDEWPADMLPPGPVADPDSEFVAPLALWVRGAPSLREVADSAIAVVGTALATDYDVIDATVEHLHRQGWGLCGTGAFGTGARVLATALRVGAPTLTIQPSGANHPHPHQHRELFDKQLEAGGLIVSAYPPDTRFAGLGRDYRAQLVAALSRATVVITSLHRGGACTTARWAWRLSRPVFAYPGSETDPVTRGNNRMIRDRTAIPLTSPAGITAAPCGIPATSAKDSTFQDPADDHTPCRPPSCDGPRLGAPADGEEFQVSWNIEITAETPLAAAREAHRIQQTQQLRATVFHVTDSHGTTHRVDLRDEDNPATGGRR